MYRNCMRALVALMVLALAAPLSPTIAEEAESPSAVLECEPGFALVDGECLEADTEGESETPAESDTEVQDETANEDADDADADMDLDEAESNESDDPVQEQTEEPDDGSTDPVEEEADREVVNEDTSVDDPDISNGHVGDQPEDSDDGDGAGESGLEPPTEEHPEELPDATDDVDEEMLESLNNKDGETSEQLVTPAEYSQWICVPTFANGGTTFKRVELTHESHWSLYEGAVAVDEATPCTDIMQTTFTLNCPDMSFDLIWDAGHEGYVFATVGAEGEENVILMLFEPSGPQGVLSDDLPSMKGVVSFTVGGNDPRQGGSTDDFYHISYPFDCESFEEEEEEEEETGATVYVLLPNGQSVAGEPFGIYTPIASTLPTGAYYTGTVGINNGLLLPALPAGTYQIKIAPADGNLIEFAVALTPTSDVVTINLRSDETQQYVQPDSDDETYFIAQSAGFDSRCGWSIWWAGDYGGGIGTVTFSNASGWSQVANVTVNADRGVVSGSWCIPDIEQEPDALVIDIVMDSGGTFRYFIEFDDESREIITGGLLVTTATEQPGETPTPVPGGTVEPGITPTPGSPNEPGTTPTVLPSDPPTGQPSGESSSGVSGLPSTGSGHAGSSSLVVVAVLGLLFASMVFVARERTSRRQT